MITTNDGVRLSVTDEGSGRPVVLIAGFRAPATSWMFQTPALLSAGYRVVGLDRRGHGLSEAPSSGARLARHGRDVHDVLTALDLRDAVLVGGSMGASTVWAFLDLFGTERVAGVVGVDQTPKMVNTPDWSCGFYGLTPENLGTFFADGIPPTGRGQAPDVRPERFARLVAALGLTEADLAKPPQPFPPAHQALLQDHAGQDWRDVVARADVPALYVAGADSEYWPSAHAEWAAASNPRARAVVLPQCGHAANIDQPEAFNAALLEFLAEV